MDLDKQARKGWEEKLCKGNAEEEQGDGDAWILKDISSPEEEEAVYEMVEDDVDLDAVGAVFESMMEDVEFTWKYLRQ